MFVINRVKIRSFERGLFFKDGEFQKLLGSGKRWFMDLTNQFKVDVVSERDVWLEHEQLDVIVKSGALQDLATIVDLKDYERALVWIDKRFDRVLDSGLYALWTTRSSRASATLGSPIYSCQFLIGS